MPPDISSPYRKGTTLSLLEPSLLCIYIHTSYYFVALQPKNKPYMQIQG